MSNTDDRYYGKHAVGNAAKDLELPPLSSDAMSTNQSTVCAIVQLYLAVWDDLTPEQTRLLSTHLQICQQCTHEQQLFQNVTRSITHLPETQPSTRVDRAVLDAIAVRKRKVTPFNPSIRKHKRTSSSPLFDLRRPPERIAILAAILVLALLTSTYFVVTNNSRVSQSATITLPSDLSWDKYVLYQEQTMTDAQGQSYHLTSYYDMSTEDANIEAVVPGKVDVVVVKDTQKALALDMLHNVAEWGVPDWVQDDISMFDLDRLRQNLQTGQATYLGTTVYKGQAVYRLRIPGGDVLLLDMNYMPVNVLMHVDATGTGQPMYNTLRWLTSSQVPSFIWNMSVPDNFKMGTLPSQP